LGQTVGTGAVCIQSVVAIGGVVTGGVVGGNQKLQSDIVTGAATVFDRARKMDVISLGRKDIVLVRTRESTASNWDGIVRERLRETRPGIGEQVRTARAETNKWHARFETRVGRFEPA